ncbi:DUF2254 domain-containing protein [Arthrobacter sp. SO3]|uniref:DUF2254 domain-containing protein n=1 Tax=Arthrobacter sp. SO3 TaxID=1897057 RepID=UPI001CFF660B|nr:DUF2254 domain-containing protein [Arthrobacter sp. SO3]
MDTLRTQLWPVPALAVILAVALGFVLPALDAAVDDGIPDGAAVFLFSGGPEAARSVLQAISGSLITVTSLTFSLTVVTLQLASSQFSPRLLRTFTADQFVHATLALFLSAFAFALTVLRSVRTESSGGTSFVPEISVTVAFVLAIASVMGLVLFLAHLTREIRVETMMRRVSAETRETIDRVFPKDRSEAVPEDLLSQDKGTRIVCSKSGFLTSYDAGALVQAAVDNGALIRVDREPGSSLVDGVPFATVWPVSPGSPLTVEASSKLQAAANAAVTTGFERTNVQDVGFGFRQLVDVAARALSPGINDPTTAVHVLGHLSALLCRLTNRHPGPLQLTDDEGRVRVVLAMPALGDLLELVMAQPRLYGIADPAVAERLLELLQELSWCDSEGRYRAEILEQVARMREALNTGTYAPADRQRLLALAQRTETMHPG